jgi:membrane associated rhomboid family serine protease
LIPLKDNVPTSRFPILTVILIAINFAVFGWELSLSTDTNSNPLLRQAGVTELDQVTIEDGAIPYRLTHPGKDCVIGAAQQTAGHLKPEIVCEGTADYLKAQQLHDSGAAPLVPLDEPPWWATIFTSMFLHAGWLHILGNMLFLWIFGNNVEDSMGRGRFLLFYLLAGIVALYAQALISTGETGPTVGASGAIAGVLGGYIVLHPRARVLSLIFIVFFVTMVEVPAVVLLGIWFVLQALPAVGQVATPDVVGTGGIAYLAHVGGFLFGMAAIKLFASRRQRMEGPAPPPVAV